jgi:ribonucleoside-diphosphate reductase beta chain
MLTWEEEAIPQAPSATQGGFHSHPIQSPLSEPATPAAPRVLNDGAVVASPSPEAPSIISNASVRRVNAADKRIINGRTDVNQLVPFKYKWAWEKVPGHLRQPLDAARSEHDT